jgi:putative transposase
MRQVSRLSGFRTDFGLEFVEREATPKPAMKLGIQLHAAGLLLSDTVAVLAGLGVDRACFPIHNWMQKASLQPTDGKASNHSVIDETVIQLNNQRYWLYAAVGPDTNKFLYVRLFSTRMIVLTQAVSSRTPTKTQCRRVSVSCRWHTMAPGRAL